MCCSAGLPHLILQAVKMLNLKIPHHTLWQRCAVFNQPHACIQHFLDVSEGSRWTWSHEVKRCVDTRYLFLTLAVVWSLVWLKETNLSTVLRHLDEPHGRPHCGITSMDKHHHLGTNARLQHTRILTQRSDIQRRFSNLAALKQHRYSHAEFSSNRAVRHSASLGGLKENHVN